VVEQTLSQSAVETFNNGLVVVKFSFTTFFAAQPMPAANNVRVAASMTVLTSLLLDMARLI